MSGIALSIAPLCRSSAHFASVAGWLHRQWHRGAGLAPATSLELLDRRMVEDPIGIVLLAMVGDTPAGTVSVLEPPPPLRSDRNTAHLAALFVHEPFRQRNVASNLCAAAEQAGHRAGMNRLVALTADQERFFCRNGWTCVERHHGAAPPMDLTFSVMQKTL